MTARSVSLFIPTLDAGPEFPEILELMLDQDVDGPLEVLVTDSGSTDGTLQCLRSRPVDLVEIEPGEFNHGLARNDGVRRASGDIVVLATQDARPTNRRWIRNLVKCFDDPGVAGAYSAQDPRPDANPFIRHRLGSWAPSRAERVVQRVEDEETLDALEPLARLERIAFDNVSSSVRRDVALEIPFRECRFGEDLDWGLRVVRAGYSICFEPSSRVVHSRDRSIWYELKRVYLDHQNLHRLLGVHTVPRWRDVVACTVDGVRELDGVVRRDPRLKSSERLAWRSKTLPYSFTQNLAQYLGARSVRGLEEGRGGAVTIDRWLGRGV